MRRHDQSARTLLEPCEIGEGPNIFGAAGVIQQQHVAPFDGALDAGNQHEAAFRGVRDAAPQVQLAVVQGDRDRVVAERHRVVDQFERRVRNRVDRIVGGVGVQLDFQHPLRLYFRIRTAGLPRMCEARPALCFTKW